MRKEPIITSKNYHVATEANWTSVEKNDLGIENYKSSSGSKYWYTNDGVYRLSNHWGDVASCFWNLDYSEGVVLELEMLAFCKFEDFKFIRLDFQKPIKHYAAWSKELAACEVLAKEWEEMEIKRTAENNIYKCEWMPKKLSKIKKEIMDSGGDIIRNGMYCEIHISGSKCDFIPVLIK